LPVWRGASFAGTFAVSLAEPPRASFLALPPRFKPMVMGFAAPGEAAGDAGAAAGALGIGAGGALAGVAEGALPRIQLPWSPCAFCPPP